MTTSPAGHGGRDGVGAPPSVAAGAEDSELEELLLSHIRPVADYPKPGILFQDITPLLGDAHAFAAAVRGLTDHFAFLAPITKVVGIEARGFLLAAPVAYACGAGFVPVRKVGKLPPPTLQLSYDLEYGSATLELAQASIVPGDRVLIVDDVLATGGTVAAVAELLEQVGAEVLGASVLLELAALGGRARLGSLPVHRLLTV